MWDTLYNLQSSSDTLYYHLAVTQQTAMLTLTIIITILSIAASEWPLLFRMEKMALPTMIHTMKQENTIPSGVLPAIMEFLINQTTKKVQAKIIRNELW